MIVFCDISCSDVVLLLSSTANCTSELSLSVQLGIPSKLLFTSLELSGTFKEHDLVSEIKDTLPSTVLIKLVELSIVTFSSGEYTVFALFSIKGIPYCSKTITLLLNIFFLPAWQYLVPFVLFSCNAFSTTWKTSIYLPSLLSNFHYLVLKVFKPFPTMSFSKLLLYSKFLCCTCFFLSLKLCGYNA